jgi:hypothetical protein
MLFHTSSIVPYYLKLLYFSPLYSILTHFKILLRPQAAVVFPPVINKRPVITECCYTITEHQWTMFFYKAAAYFAIRPVQRKMNALLRRTWRFISANVHLPALFIMVPGSYWIWMFYRSWRQRPLASSINPHKKILCFHYVTLVIDARQHKTFYPSFLTRELCMQMNGLSLGIYNW